MTDEKAPKEGDFAMLLLRLWNAPEGAALVFNCQMGRGRTTTGMIIASLLQLKRASPDLSIPERPAGVRAPACAHASMRHVLHRMQRRCMSCLSIAVM